MSWRTWTGDGIRSYADFNWSEFSSVERLAEEIKWLLPCKIFGDITLKQRIIDLLRILDTEYSMPPAQISCIVLEVDGQRSLIIDLFDNSSIESVSQTINSLVTGS